jgi:hypothetical protein
MLDELIAQLVGEAAFGRLAPSRRAQILARLFFGLLGTALGAIGAVHFLLRPMAANPGLHASMVLLFVFLACFCLFNVALLRRWKWPGLGFLGCLVSMFVMRIAFGA